MFSLNLPVNDEAGSRQASARRVAPLSSRKSSRQTLDEGKLFTSQSQDGHESTDDSSLDDFDLLYDSYSERSSNSNDSDSSDDSEDSEQGGRSIDSDGEDNRGSSEDRQDGGDDHDRSEHADGAADKAAEVVGRPPRLSLPALEVPTASVDGVRGLEPFESARRARCTANTDHATNSEVGEGLAKHTVNVELLTPCFELSISTGEDPARQVAQKFAVSQERVRVMMHDRERLAVQLLGSSFSLVKLEEKMAENASLHARVAELERKLASSESLRLKAHRTLQELRREVDALEEFVCTKR